MKEILLFPEKTQRKALGGNSGENHGLFREAQAGNRRGHVSDSIQQILEASCLEFENRPDDAAPPSEPWEKRVKLKSSIDNPRSLLRSIDRFLSEIILRESIPKEINCEALSTVLYGTAEKPELVKQVRRMVGRSDQAVPSISSIP